MTAAHDPAGSPADIVAEHLAECTDAKAAIVVDGNADEVIAGLLAAGWTLSDRAELIAGKRIRYLRTPAGQTLAEGTPAMKDVYLLVKALVPEDVTQADVRDTALESLTDTLDWTWDVAVSEHGTPEDPAVTELARDWHELAAMLIELEAAGALSGIRAIISEHLQRTRRGLNRGYAPGGPGLAAAALAEVQSMPFTDDVPGRAAMAAALLAAVIDRTGGTP